MQAASWVGRTSGDRLSRVSAHLYAEFDGHDLDPDRLRAAVRLLCRRHPMLTLRLDAEDRQRLDAGAEPLPVDVEDLRGQPAEARHRHLAAKRRAWTHRTLDLARGQAAAFGLSLLPGGACRLHVDTDMIAVDPNSFRIVMEDLAGLYEDPRSGADGGAPGFFDWLDGMSADTDAARRRERDRIWWRSRLRDIAPAPPLPPPTGAGRGPLSDRLATWLSPDERGGLETCARLHRITPSGLLLGLFAAVLGPAMGAERFRLNVPTFWREPVVPDVGRIVGDFSNVLILSVDLAAAETLGGLCRTIGAALTQLLGHAAYPGVSVMRDLSRHHGGLQTAPVVFTAGLDRAGGDLFTERVGRVLGRMNWVISQGPQVALDAQVAAFEGGLLINFDVRLDALPEPWIREVFDGYAGLLRAVADGPAALDRPLRTETIRPAAAAPSATETMLIALLRRLAPGEPAGGEIPVASVARPGLRAFIATYLADGGPVDDAVRSEATPRRLAAQIRAGSGGRSDAVARIFLETFDEG